MQVGGTQIHKFSVEADSPHFEQAQRVVSWIEEGIFDALVNGYLEKCMLVVAHDEKCENPIEVWDLTLTWDGDTPTPNVGCSRLDQGHQETSLAPPASSTVTKDDVRRAAQMMMRRLSCLLQGLDEIPTDHWIGMRLLYRDGVTPSEYEPTGFYQAPSTDAGCFVFQAPPTFVSAGRLSTGHNSLSVGVAMAEVPGFDPTPRDKACTAAADGGGYSFDLVRATSAESNVPSAVSNSATAGDRLPQLIDRAKALLSERLGSQITAHALARELRTSPPIAEEVLQILQNAEPPLVSTVRPSTRSREVLDPEAQYAGSQWDAMSVNDGEMSEASFSRHPSAGAPYPMCLEDGMSQSFAAASPGCKAARPSFRHEVTPSRGPEAAVSRPASVRGDSKRGSQQGTAALSSPAPAALPVRESSKEAGKRKASQVLAPIGRPSRRHASSQRS
jgi:hypothetical protein